MKILIVGGGGREHALAWKIAQSPKVSRVFVAPGNAGTQFEEKCENVAIDVLDIPALISFSKKASIDFTIIGPEAPLAEGIVDQFNEEGLNCFGPSQAAAQLEASKSFSKDFMQRNNIPTADYQSFNDSDAAKQYIKDKGTPIVVKADGLAAGKGVIIAQNQQEAFDAVEDILDRSSFGEAGASVVIEEFLEGEEASFIVMVDGQHILPLASSQDHKARDDGDKGPNTGGMGAYSPAPVVTPELSDRVIQDVILPTVNAFAAQGTPYTGFLYAGLMISKSGEAKVLEFNCRFGDPETQPILMRLKTDLVDLCLAAFDKRLDQVEAQWDPRCALGVVLAAGGYPTQYNKGDVIEGIEDGNDESIKVFHAGTKQEENNVITNGGRVLCVTALGKDISEAQTKAYQRVKQINWNNVYYRNDIGYRAISRES